MKKLIDRPGDSVKETMEGIIYAYGDKVGLLDDDGRIFLTNYSVEQGKVGIIIAGGGGHLPVFLGYVGQGMLDGCAVGNVFASPSAKKMADMTKARNHGSGVLCLYENYGGDNVDFGMVYRMVEVDDVKTRTVHMKDGVVSNPRKTREKHRGAAGVVCGSKVAGAAAGRMMSLDEVTAVAEKALDSIRTMGVAPSPCTVPQVSESTFKIGDDETEVGMGIHGEKGTEARKMMTADEVAKTPVDRITQDMPLIQGGEVSVLANGLRAIPMEGQLITYRCIRELLAEKGVKIIIPHIGEYAASTEVIGLSVTVSKLDEQSKEPLTAPAKTPLYTNLSR